MSSLCLPVSGAIKVVDGYSTVKKFFLPSQPRLIQPGTPMWNNGSYGIEPAMLAIANKGQAASATTSRASTMTSLDGTGALSANQQFAAYFAGFAAERRGPRQLATVGQFGVPGNFTAYADDASPPFMSVYTEGIAVAPYYWDNNGTWYNSVQTQLEIGQPIELAGFVNEATTGFYDPAGELQLDTKTYLYNNAMQQTNILANAIGFLVERALVGDTYLKFQFQATIINPGYLASAI